MGATPQPPRPPVPPAPPRTGSHILGIALLVLALIIVVSGLAVWMGLRFISRNVQITVAEADTGKKEVSIKTPLGSLEVAPDVDVSRLGLPIYPGAVRIKDKDSAAVNIDIAGEGSVQVLVATFKSPDQLQKVRDFYRAQLGSDVTKYKETPGKEAVFEIKKSGQEKVVALEVKGDGTRIALVRVLHGKQETN